MTRKTAVRLISWTLVILVLMFLITVSLAFALDTPTIARQTQEYLVEVRVKIKSKIPLLKFEKEGSGSGFFIDKNGHLLTNNHVVDHDTDSIKVSFKNKLYDAKVLGKDRFSDLALLRVENIDASKYTAADLGDSDALAVGQNVVVAGNPKGLLGSISRGIISGLNRFVVTATWPILIQTDASVDHGNSGGPLIEQSSGKVVGVVNSTMVSFAFAIPINTAKRFVMSIFSFGKPRWGYLGAEIIDVPVPEEIRKEKKLPSTSAESGVMITDVRPESPALKAGLAKGDIILKIGDEEIFDAGSLKQVVALKDPGSRNKALVQRGAKKMELNIVWGERPDNY